MGKKTAGGSGRSARACLLEVSNLAAIETAGDSMGPRRQRARRHAPGAQGGHRDGTAAGVGGVPSQLRLVGITSSKTGDDIDRHT